MFSPSDDEGFFERIGHPAYRFFYDIKNSLNVIAAQENETNKNKSLKTDYNPKKINMHYSNYILVIGESVRRDYMGAYGFKINNTPFLSKSNGMFFENYTSASFGTVLSLTNSLLYNNKRVLEFNNNIIRLAKSAGLYTYWISNQGRFGIHDGPIAAIGKEADHFYFIKNGDSNDNKILPDEAVLPKISSALKTEVNKLVVVHLMGSHPDPCVRTGGHFNWWYHNKNKSCYIQSIRNTDRLLEEITKLARSQNNNWTILYFADHGLSQDKKDGNLKHSDEFKENFMPPLVIINSDFNKKIRVTALRTGMDFIKMFAQWIGIEDNKTLSQCNYLSNEICYKDVNVIDKTGSTRSFSSLKNEEPSN